MGGMVMASKKTIQAYESEIKELHMALKEYPDNEIIQSKLNNRVGSWAKLINITIFAAQNEQLPWGQEDLGYPVRPMLLKEKSGIQQVGDYQAYYSAPGYAGWVGVLVERKGGKTKGCEDLYSTLMGAENCARFYREIDRFKEDPRFTQMVIIAECTLNDFLLYNPPFNGKERNINHIGANVEARRGKIASLYTRVIPVLFAGTRKNAIELYKSLIRQWLRQNYSSILKLDVVPYNDYQELLDKKSIIEEKKDRLEAEYQAVCGALGAINEPL